MVSKEIEKYFKFHCPCINKPQQNLRATSKFLKMSLAASRAWILFFFPKPINYIEAK